MDSLDTHRQSLPGAAFEGARRGLCPQPDTRPSLPAERRVSGGRASRGPEFAYRLRNRAILGTPLHSRAPRYAQTRSSDVVRDITDCGEGHCYGGVP